MTDDERATWHLARRMCFTASEFHVAMTGTPKGWRGLLGRIRAKADRMDAGDFSEFQSEAMLAGHHYEAQAHALLEMEFGYVVTPVPAPGFIKMTERTNVGGSPDGLIGEDGITEIKTCIAPGKFDEWVKKGPPLPQCQGNLMVTGRKFCIFTPFDPHRADFDQMRPVRVERDEDYIGRLRLRVFGFAGYLARGTEPKGEKWLTDPAEVAA